MTLQSSGPLKASEIQTEFGGSSPFRLSDYYAGGANVPAGTVGDGGPIPSSGTISFSDFYGASNIIDVPKTLTVGEFSGARGFLDGVYGSLSPDELFRTVQIDLINANAGTILIQMAGSHPQDFWIELDITGGPTLLSTAATFVDDGDSKWSFTNAFAFPNASYPLNFTYLP